MRDARGRFISPNAPVKAGKYVSKGGEAPKREGGLRFKDKNEAQRLAEKGELPPTFIREHERRVPASAKVDERKAGLRPGTFTRQPYGPNFKGAQAWAAHPATDPYVAHTFYMVIQVEASARGIAYEYEDIDADAPDQYATLALTKTNAQGEVVGLKYAELVRNFEQYAIQAIRRAGVFPKGTLRESVVGVFRHKVK
jgi:hypothetical protein